MRISNILKSMDVDIEYSIVREKEFKTMGLVASCTDIPMCTFVDSEKYVHYIPKNSVMIITTKELAEKLSVYGICIADNPRILFFSIHNYLQDDEEYCRKRFKTEIGEYCKISGHAIVAKDNVKIGNNVIIEEYVSIKENTEIGDNSIIRAGSVIGGEGFEFKRVNKGIMSVKHLGGVKIGRNVEIQYNACIDKAVYPWDNTVVSDNVKIDNFVHIAHAVKLGKNIMIAGNTSIAGRVVIGDNSWIGPSVMISNGLTIGANCHIGLGSVVVKSIPDSLKVFGNPARPYDIIK